ncbi:restriction endonuclease subunit S [Fusobacterium polymorphum]|uniref:Restriction endonuclease n=1 Tax=Fusobacterium nucleatum subsp. polymorphum TaxID=76857 RepID=A0A2C6CBX0_FUSNP|nr:restriction endonuclease subunit S [Fusobacterium polymorphum]PHI13562.1 restriction endonuclease [Fusobacterium polymorphum]
MKNKKVNLNDICFFQEGPGVRKYQYCTKGVKLINVSNLVNGEVDLSNSNRYISQEEAYGRYKHFLIDEGDLIIASSGIKVEYLDKKVAFIKKENLPLCMNTSTIRFKVKNKNELDILYLSYFLKSKNFKNQISKLITGSAQLNFGGSHLKKINLFLPELNVQKKVSTLLLLIDNTIKNMQRKISILEQLTKSLFTRMFGDIKTNDKNWKIKKFHKIISILTDYHANGSYKILKDNVELLDFKEYALMIRTTDLENNNFIQGVKYINEKAYNFLKKTKIFGGELIINKIGSAGNVYLMPYLNIPVSLGMNQFMIRLKKNYSNIFYYKLLTTEYYTNVIKSNVQGAVTKTITKEAIKNIDIIIPPIELQNKFAERIEKIEKLKFTIWKIILKVYKILKKKGVENN